MREKQKLRKLAEKIERQDRDAARIAGPTSFGDTSLLLISAPGQQLAGFTMVAIFSNIIRGSRKIIYARH